MQDAVWLLHATPQGVPAANGVDGHFVLWSSVPPVAVSQLHLGGWTPDWDCAEGCLTSALKRRGLPVPSGRMLELEALTNNRYGTGWDGLIHAAAINGLDPSAVIHGDPPQGWIMNPAWGGVIPPQGFWPYLAASQHMYIELRAPVVQPQPTVTEDKVLLIFAATLKDGTSGAEFLSDGMHFRHILNPTEYNDIAAVTGPVFNRGTVSVWANNQRVADVYAFGRPVDQHTADILGLPFP